MTFVIALSAFATLLALLNSLLIVVLVKRVRELDQAVADLNASSPQPMLPAGVAIDEFETHTADGEALTHESLPKDTMVGFFSPSCETCHGHLPGWMDEAGALGRDRALAVVRDEDASEDMTKPLSTVARVVVENRRGPVSRAFGVQATPAFCRMGPGHVIEEHGYHDPRERR